MDARARLRLYLEQRRDLGESELVLDSMSVDEVLRVLGALGSGGAGEGAPSAAPRPAASPPSRGVAPPPSPAAPPDETPSGASPVVAPRHGPEASGDWRTALGGAGPQRGIPRGDFPPPGPGRGPSPATGAPTPASASLPPTGIVVGAAGRDLFRGDIALLASLEAVAATVARCTRCPLHATALNPVPGEGSATAELVCVGEAPGANEDETGRPFVGAAGQLLTKILAAIDLRREDVFICNVLKHRPPGNRNPRPEEVAACSPYLLRQLELIKPRVIVAFGTFAAQTLLDTPLSLGKLRGVVHQYYGTPLVVTYHPAALLRNPAWKRPTWEDVQLARRILDRSRGVTGAG